MADSLDSGSASLESDPSAAFALAAPLVIEHLEEAIAGALERGALPLVARLSHRVSQCLYFNSHPSWDKALKYALFAVETSQVCVSDHHIDDGAFELDL